MWKSKLNKSISEIDNWVWNERVPNKNDSGIEYRYYKLHTVPIENLELKDLRFLIIQEECLEVLVPYCLKILKNNLSVETEYYKGDLLGSLLSLNQDFYKKNPKLKKQIKTLVYMNHSEFKKLGKELTKSFNALIKGENRDWEEFPIAY